MYGKIFASIYEGSLYGNWKALVTFQQLIVLCNVDGVVDMTPQALAARTSIPLEIIQEGLAALESPDPYSRTPDRDGRRIERLDESRPWGWVIVNYVRYRNMVRAEEKRAADRRRMALKRATHCDVARPVANGRKASRAVAKVAHADVDVEVDAKKEREGAQTKPHASRFALASLPEEWKEFCNKERPDLDPDAVFADFADYWRARPGKDGLKLDWPATWQRWVRTQKASTSPVAADKPWHATASGTQAMGAQLGIRPEEFVDEFGRQNWQAFRATVLERAGVVAEVRQ